MTKASSVRLLAALALLLSVVGCSQSAPQPDAPRPRLVTFSPALTRLVFDMGLGDHVVGVSAYSRLPRGVARPVVGDTLNVRVEPILAVKPDILLLQMDATAFEPLRRVDPDLRVEHFSIENLQDVADAMERIGVLVGKPGLGLERKRAFLDKLDAIRKRAATLEPVPALFVLGYQSPSGPGSGTFIDEMITLAGGRNILAREFKGWRKPSLESIVALAPQVIICQCKPEDQTEAAAYWKALQIRTPHRVVTVTDDDWTLPAGHLADYSAELLNFIHPELKPSESAK